VQLSRNPYIELFYASLGLFAGIALGVGPFTVFSHASAIELVALFGLATIAFVVTGRLGTRAFRRLPWWHAARAEARRSGGPMPTDLQFLG